MTIFGKIVLGALILVVGGGAFYGVVSYVSNDALTEKEIVAIATTTPVVVVATTTASTTPEKPLEKKMAFAELMKQGGSYKCTVTQNVSTMSSDGIVYIHDDFIKATFSTNVGGQTIGTSMIARDGYTYSWTTTSKGVGYKAKISEKTGAPTNASTSATYAWNGDQIGEYDCQPWVADDTMFDLPKSITFSLL